MRVTIEKAREILAKHYPREGRDFLITKRQQIGVRPIAESSVGMLTLAWQRETVHAGSMVRIGKVDTRTLEVDWNWQDKDVKQEQQLAAAEKLIKAWDGASAEKRKQWDASFKGLFGCTLSALIDGGLPR